MSASATQGGHKNCHLRTIAQRSRAVSSQLRHLLTIGKKLTKQQCLFQTFPLTAEIGSGVCGTPVNFNGFRVLPRCTVCNVGVLQPNSWMDQDATWYRGRPQPRRHCFRWGPRCPLSKRTAILAFSSPSGKILIVAYYQNYCIYSNQILHNDKDHQMSFMGRSNARHKSKIADGRHLEKIEKSLYLSDY